MTNNQTVETKMRMPIAVSSNSPFLVNECCLNIFGHDEYGLHDWRYV